MLLPIIVGGFIILYEYELLSSNIKLKAKPENELGMFSRVSGSFNDFNTEKAGTIRIYINSTDFNCRSCLDNLLGFFIFLKKNENLLAKFLIYNTFLVNFNVDSLNISKEIGRRDEVYQIKFSVHFYKLQNLVEGIKNYIIVFNRSGKILFAIRLPLKNNDHNRILNVLEKL